MNIRGLNVNGKIQNKNVSPLKVIANQYQRFHIAAVNSTTYLLLRSIYQLNLHIIRKGGNIIRLSMSPVSQYSILNKTVNILLLC